MKTWTAIMMVCVALVAWGGFGALVWQLSIARADYASTLELSKENALRGESAARLQTSIDATVAEREALEQLVAVSILRAVEVIEQAGAAAGASNVTIGEATPTGTSEGLSIITIVVNASGSFGALMRAVALYETLPIPATLEQFELVKLSEERSWQLTARVRILTAPTSQ
jgi:hypothetical protein